MFPNRSRISPLKLAGVVAIAATSLAAAPTALAATSGGAAVTPAAHAATSAPFTIGLSSNTVKPGAKFTISGLAFPRAGLNVTILSRAISSARTVNGLPAVQTPALVEGIYQTTVRIAPATKPGVYSVQLRFGNRLVASTSSLRVVARAHRPAARPGSIGAPGSASRSCTTTTRIRRIYRVAGTPSSPNMACGTASAEFTSFLAAAGKPTAGWTTTSPAAGRATFTQRSTGFSFTVTKAR